MFYIKNNEGGYLTNTAGYCSGKHIWEFVEKPRFGTIKMPDKAFLIKWCKRNGIKNYILVDE